MDDSLKTGLMAVFAVSGSVVFLSMQAHKRLLSNFINTMEFQIIQNSTVLRGVRDKPKKKVRFADDVEKLRPRPSSRDSDQSFKAMPQNWQVMYKGILQHRNLLRAPRT